MGKRTNNVAFRKIEAMKCFEYVRAQLIIGEPAGKMVTYIQQVEGELTEYTERTLRAHISAYRRSISAVELVAKVRPKFVKSAMEEIEQGIDELQELAEIYKIQKKRIIMGHKVESDLKVVNRQLGNEVRIAAELLRTSFQIKADLGARSSHTGQADPSAVFDTRSRFGTVVADVMANPAKRTRVLEAAKRVLEARESDEEQQHQTLRLASGG